MTWSVTYYLNAPLYPKMRFSVIVLCRAYFIRLNNKARMNIGGIRKSNASGVIKAHMLPLLLMGKNVFKLEKVKRNTIFFVHFPINYFTLGTFHVNVTYFLSPFLVTCHSCCCYTIPSRHVTIVTSFMNNLYVKDGN